MMYRHTFEVTGHMRFPLDMLRYDACYPADSDSAARMGYTFDVGHPREVFVIKLVAINSFKTWAPTADRWSSFSWSVVNGSLKTTRTS